MEKSPDKSLSIVLIILAISVFVIVLALMKILADGDRLLHEREPERFGNTRR